MTMMSEQVPALLLPLAIAYLSSDRLFGLNAMITVTCRGLTVSTPLAALGFVVRTEWVSDALNALIMLVISLYEFGLSTL